jgi:N utilization substance protein A
VKDVPGVTTAMLVKFGENGIKTVEDLAGCATDDSSAGRAQGRRDKRAPAPRRFEVSREEAEAMIMQARCKPAGSRSRPRTRSRREEPAEEMTQA